MYPGDYILKKIYLKFNNNSKNLKFTKGSCMPWMKERFIYDYWSSAIKLINSWLIIHSIPDVFSHTTVKINLF